MAGPVVNTVSETSQLAQQNYGFSHTISGLADRFLLVGVSLLSVAGSKVNAITCGSVNLTRLRLRQLAAPPLGVELWGLVAPPTGLNLINVSLSSAVVSSAIAIDFSNVNQGSATEAATDNSATNVGAADATLTITTTSDNDLVVNVVATNDTAIVVGAAQTQAANVFGAFGSGAMAYKTPISPAGATAMNWTNVDAGQSWVIAGLGVRSALFSPSQFPQGTNQNPANMREPAKFLPY